MQIKVRPLEERDLAAADRIFRLAFGTFDGLPDPARFGGDADKIRTRWLADPAAAWGAEADGRLVGSNFVTHWGSVGYFGPLTVHPDFWDRGVAQKLLGPTLALFEAWGCRHTGLYTYANSPKHLTLYQKFGFWPRFLTAIMHLEVRPQAPAADVSFYSQVPEDERSGLLEQGAALTGAIYPGLDVRREILAVAAQALGDTLLLRDGEELTALAVVHCGAGSEAGSGAGFVKFGAVRPGPDSARNCARLLSACEAFAAARGAGRLIAGTNLAREGVYRQMRARGFRPLVLGVAMHKPNEPGYHRPDAWVLDDWR